MSRFPPRPLADMPESWNDTTRPAAGACEEHAEAAFGANGDILQYKNEEDALIGPFPTLIASGDAGSAFLNLASSLAQFKSSFPDDAREVAILTVAAHYEAKYEIYAHSQIAVKLAGLTQEQVDTILNGEKPADLSPAAAVAYNTATYLLKEKGPLPEDKFETCTAAFGKEGTLGLIHYTGLYSYASILLNAVDAPVPTNEPIAKEDAAPAGEPTPPPEEPEPAPETEAVAAEPEEPAPEAEAPAEEPVEAPVEELPPTPEPILDDD